MIKTGTVSLRPWLTFVLSIWAVFFPDFSASQSVQDTSQSKRAEAHAQAGIQFAQAGNISSAESELRNAVALSPSNVEWLRSLATILAMEKKFEESTAYFQRALKIDPKDSIARRYLAANFWQMRRFAEARQNLQILLSANPRNPDALLLLGMVAENTKDYATAVKALASVPALVRAQPESIAALARSYYHVGENEKARAWLRELQNHAAGIKALLLGAQIADEMRDYETAEAVLSSAEQRYSDQGNWKYRMALVKFHARQFEESEQILQTLVNDGHKTSEVDRLLASCYREQGRDDDAIRALQEAIQLDPASEASYLDLATILLTKKRISAAAELSQQMATAFPNSPRAFASKGSIELGAGAYVDAVRSFERALQLEPRNEEATIGHARAQANAGMVDRAKVSLEQAISRFPNKARFELELARVLLKEGETGNQSAELRAEQLLHSAVGHDNKLTDAHYELGELALRRGEASAALMHLERAAKLDPSSAKTHFALSRAYRSLGRKEDGAREAALFDKLKE